MSFHLTIDCDNAAFTAGQDAATIETAGPEVARILRDLADRLAGGNPVAILVDINGNRVGAARFTA